jgi:hypothetical protein
MVSYVGEEDGHFHWCPMFHGKLHDLYDIYDTFYPSPQPYFWQGKCYSCLSPRLITFADYQLQEAKDHLDKFIHRFNRLAIYF